MRSFDVAPLESLVGPTSLRCWPFVRYVFSEHQGVLLPESPFDAVRQFVKVDEPQPWDIVVIKNHPVFENHVGVMVSPNAFAHSMRVGSDTTPETDDTPREVTIGFVHRSPWNEPGRIARYLRLRT